MAQLVKTVNSLAIASVKTVDSLAIASVKTIMSVDNTSGGGASLLQTVGNTDYTDTFDWSYYLYLAGEFVAGGNYNITEIHPLLVGGGGGSAGTFIAEIWTKSGANPGALVGTSSGAVDRTTVTSGTPTYIPMTGVVASLTSGVSYYVVVRTTSTSGTWAWVRQVGTVIGKGSDSSGATWDSIGSNVVLGFQLWGS